MSAVPELAEFVETLSLVDHHVHGPFRESIVRVRFENALNEGSTDPLPGFVSGFDSQLGSRCGAGAPHCSTSIRTLRQTSIGPAGPSWGRWR